MKKFYADIVLQGGDICNLKQDAATLLSGMTRGERIVFLGRRNMGKTSLVKGKLIPAFRQAHPGALIVFVDLMGVKNFRQICERMQSAFEAAITQARPAQAFLAGLVRTLAHVRPTFSADPLTGESVFSLGLEAGSQPLALEKLVGKIGEYHKQRKALLIMDEFQDIAGVEEAEARFRNSLQNLPGDLGVIAMGSKKHILARIFAEHRAPLANWGRQIEISRISAADYLPYINERLGEVRCSLDSQDVTFVLEEMRHNPEAVNLIGAWLQNHCEGAGKLSRDHIYLAIGGVLGERDSLYREYVSRFSDKEETFLRALAKLQPLEQPYSAEFLGRIRMSPGGARPLVRRLEDQGVIDREEEGLMINDPILALWLQRS